MDNIIEIKDLHKYFGEVKAVDGISFSVKRGSLFAFLGLNGAGKSTTISILCTLLQKDSGEVTIDGFNLDKQDALIRKNIGIVFQNTVLDERLSVKDNLTARASFYGLRGAAWEKRLGELTAQLELGELLKRPFGKLSGGQKRRVDIARSLIHCPKLLFLDEPTTGLDPKTRRLIWQIINDIRATQDMTVFLTTHYMEEAEQADDVVIIDSGKTIAQGSPAELKSRFSGDYVKLYCDQGAKDEVLTARGYAFSYKNGAYVIKMDNDKSALDFIRKNEDIIEGFEVVKGNMDDVFLNATGKSLEV